ncbi:MAG: TonB family protein [Bacteroidales bacterium]|nr:TonB family protein [Bacteroidales bacterium]
MNAQELIIGHLLSIAVAIMVLWLVYRLLFRNSNRLKFNRFYLITAMLFSLALPLIGLMIGTESQQMVSLKQNLFGGMMLNEITVTANGTAVLSDAELATATRLHFTLWQILGGIYLIGVGVMTLLFLFKVGKIVALILRSPKEKREGYTAVFFSKVSEPACQTTHGGVSTGSTTATNKVPEPVEGPTQNQGSFSFLNFSFFPDENVAPDIVKHELSHIRHHHSVDVLFAETMMIIQWFNPFIYLYKKELQSLHEYQADRDVVATGVDKKNYMMLILQQCTAVDFSGMSNNFSLILTKKRLKMITRNEKNKRLGWRLLATLPVLAVLLIANTKVTAQDDGSIDKADMGINTLTVYYYEQHGEVCPYTTSSLYEPDGSYYDIKVNEETIEDGTMRTAVTFTKFDKDGNPMLAHLDQIPFTQAESISKEIPDNDSIYQQVDVMPEFPGGQNAMIQFMVDNVTYPQKAKDANIQGKVYVSFVVEKDGSVGDVKLMRGIGGGCDEEAVRVVKAMPKWVPGKKDGKNVRVSYVLPIFFKLNDEEKVDQKDLK